MTVGGGANQNVVGVTVGTTVDVVTEVGDCDDASASCAHPVPSQQLVEAAYCRAPNHHVDMPDDGAAAVNDVLHDAQGEAQAFHNDDNRNNCHGMAEELGTVQAVDISQVDMILVDNSRVGGAVDDGEGEVQE